jgi:hypothetical protein
MSRISNQPRTQTLNGVVFTDDEVAALASWFQAGVPAILDKADIVASSEIQKGMKAAAVYSNDINSGATANVYITADGYELMGFAGTPPVPPSPAPITFTDDEVADLRALYPQMDLLVLPAATVRSTPVLVKAAQAQIVQVGSGAAGQIVLRLTQKGRALLGPR